MEFRRVTSRSSDADGQSAQTVKTELVTVDPLAPTVTTAAASGTEQSPISLHVTSALTDTPDGKTLTTAISSIPSGATLSDGTNTVVVTTGSQNVSPWIFFLMIRPPPKSTLFPYTTPSRSSDADGQSAQTVKTELVTVDPLAPTVTTAAASGTEQSPISLHVTSEIGRASCRERV